MNKLNKLAVAAVILGLPTLASASEDWTGFYVGGHLGTNNLEISSGSSSVKDKSTVYGLQVGYNYSMPNDWVIGGELSYSTAEYSDSSGNFDVHTARLKFKPGYSLGSSLVYGVLGYASVSDIFETLDGVTYGIGINYKATDNIILGAEVLHDSVSKGDMDVDVNSLNFGVSYQF